MEKYIIIILCLIIIYLLCFNNKWTCVENVANTSTDKLNSDLVDSINNLGQLAQDIQKPTGLTLPGSLVVTNNVDISGNLNVTGTSNLTSRIISGNGIKVDISNNIPIISCLPLVAGSGIDISYNTNNLPIVSLSQSIFYTTMTSANNLYNVNITSQYNPSVITLIFNNCIISTGKQFLSNMTVVSGGMGYMNINSSEITMTSHAGLTTDIFRFQYGGSPYTFFGSITLRRISTISSINTASVYNISAKLQSNAHLAFSEGTVAFTSLNNLTVNTRNTPDLTKLICTYQI